MPARELLIFSLLLVVIFGGIGWTKLMYWHWLREREKEE